MYYRMRRDVLQTYFGSIEHLVTECVLVVSEEGFDALQVDTANVCMINSSINSTGFDIIPEMGDEGANMYGRYGLDLAKVMTILNVLEADIDMRIDGTFMMLSSAGDSFNIRLLDPSTIKPVKQVPNLDSLDASMLVDPKDFLKGMKNCSIVSDKLRIEIDPDIKKGKIIATGDSDSYNKDIESASEIEGNYANTLFSLDYLTEVAKVFAGSGTKHPGVADTMKIRLKTDHPILITATFDIMGINMTYMLAPRIEAD